MATAAVCDAPRQVFAIGGTGISLHGTRHFTGWSNRFDEEGFYESAHQVYFVVRNFPFHGLLCTKERYDGGKVFIGSIMEGHEVEQYPAISFHPIAECACEFRVCPVSNSCFFIRC